MPPPRFRVPRRHERLRVSLLVSAVCLAALCGAWVWHGLRVGDCADSAEAGVQVAVTRSTFASGTTLSPSGSGALPGPPPLAQAERDSVASSQDCCQHGSAGEQVLAADVAGLQAHLLTLLRKDPSSALQALHQLPEPLRGTLSLAVYEVLGAHPDHALRELSGLLSTGHAHASGASRLGSVIQASLLRQGAFVQAAQALGLVSGDTRAEWLAQLCSAWAAREPERGARLESWLREEGTDHAALRSLYLSWSGADPRGLLAHAATLPAGEDRALALAAGLHAWLLTDPSEASLTGLRSAISDTEFDQALHGYLVRADSLHRDTAQALALAREIADPSLRESALAAVLREWAASDRDAARAQVLGLQPCDERQRARLLASLEPPPSSDAN